MRPAFVLLIALRLAGAADFNPGSFFPADAKAVIGIRLQALGAAGLFQGIDGEIRKTASGALQKSPLAGFDPLKDLDEVLIASIGTGEKAPALVVLRGRFPLDKLDAGVKRYRDAVLIESPDARQSGIIALIDANTALLGEAEHVIAAIDRYAAGSDTKSPLVSRMEALRAKCSIWGFGDGLESLAGPDAKPGDLSSIDRFEFGVSFEKGLKLAAEVHVRTPQDAEKLTASLKLVEAMMKGSQKKTAKNPGFDLRADDKGTLRFSLILPESEMKKAMLEEKGSLMAAISSGMPALMASRQMKAIVPQAEPAAPPAPPVQYRPAVSADSTVHSNSEGDTVIVTLPGNIPVKP